MKHYEGKTIKYNFPDDILVEIQDLLELMGVCFCGGLFDIRSTEGDGLVHMFIIVDGKEATEEEYHDIIKRTDVYIEEFFKDDKNNHISLSSICDIIRIIGVDYSNDVQVCPKPIPDCYTGVSKQYDIFRIYSAIYTNYIFHSLLKL